MARSFVICQEIKGAASQTPPEWWPTLEVVTEDDHSGVMPPLAAVASVLAVGFVAGVAVGLTLRGR